MKNAHAGLRYWLTVVVLATTMAFGAPFDGWLYKSKLTFSGYEGTETLENFPALVVISSGTISGFDHADCLADGADIRFSDATGNEIPYEIESWNSEGESHLWVRVPEISSATDYIYLHWGMSGVETPLYRGEDSVWAGGYEAVWHMNESDPIDATGNGNSGTGKNDIAASATGIAGAALQLNRSSSHYVNCGNGLKMYKNDATLSVWFKTSTPMVQAGIIGKSLYTNFERYSIYLSGSELKGMFQAATSVGVSSSWNNQLYNNEWHQLALSFNRSGNMVLYVDGQARSSASISSSVNTSLQADRPFYIGAYANAQGTEAQSGFYFDGALDEGRFMSMAAPTDWIRAEYQNIASNDIFVSYGDAEILVMSVIGANGLHVSEGAAADLALGNDFGLALTNSVYVDRTFVITNCADATFTLTADPVVALVGGAGAFSIEGQPAKTIFNPGESSQFTLRFEPTEFGPYSATIAIATDIEELPLFSFEVAGFGDSGAVVGVLGVDGAQLVSGAAASEESGTDFGVWAEKAPTEMVRTFTITNSGTHQLILDEISISGAGVFALEGTESLAAPLQPGESRALTVAFNTTLDGVFQAEITLTNNTVLSPFVIMLHGERVSPVLLHSGNSYVDLGTPDKLQLPDNHPFTVEGWVKFTSVSGTRMLYSKNSGRSSSAYTYMFGIRDSGKVMTANTGGKGNPANAWCDAAAPSTLQVGRWYHLGYAFDGTNISFYLDGECLGTKPYSFGNYPAHIAKIGDYANSYDIQGFFREVRLWERGRNQSEIKATMMHQVSGIEPDLVACWPLDEGEGGIIYDIGRGSETGTLVGGVWERENLPPELPRSNELYISGDSGLFGEVEPPYGVTAAADGEEIAFAVPSEVELDPRDDRYRGIYKGYAFYTNSLTPPLFEGEKGSFVYTHNSDYSMALLLWRWEEECRVDVGVTGFGTTSEPGGWFKNGDTVTITALPDSGNHFYYWSGDVPEGGRYNATLTLEVDRALSVTAHFGSGVYVSKTGNDTNDGRSWEQAKATIQAAIDEAETDEHVVVGDGTYVVETQVLVNKGITLRSLNGPEKVVITRGSANTRLLNISHDEAFVTGFTVSNAYIANTAGTGIYMTSGTVSNCVVTKCAANRGSIVYATGGRVTHSIIRDNREEGNYLGIGAVYLNAGKALIEHSLITGNRSGSDSGGVAALRMVGICEARNCIITGNLGYSPTTLASTAIYMSGAGSLLRNCLVADNSTRGVYMSGSGTIENCTIARNFIYGRIGSGINIAAGTVVNSIIYYNGLSPYSETACDLYQTGGTITYSCSGLLASGAGNIDKAPLFADPANNDYTLLPGSPCIDSGTERLDVTDDLSGNARPVNGSGSGAAAYDMGCYEAAPLNYGDLRCGFTASQNEGINQVTTTFTPYIAGSDADIVFVGWSFGDGALLMAEQLEPVIHSYGIGLYDVTLTVSNTLGQGATTTLRNEIRVAPEAAYVALDGGHIYPYDTWAKAANTIQAALDVILITNGQQKTVWVSNGVHQVNNFEISTGLRLTSLNGPEVTSLHGGDANRGFRCNHPDALIDGLTLTKCSAQGAAFNMSAGTVSNCVVKDNRTDRGSIAIVSGSNSLLTHSLITDSVDKGNYLGCGGVRLSSGARMRYCTITRSKGGSEGNAIIALEIKNDSVAEYCIITNNQRGTSSAASRTIVMENTALLRNCLIADNEGRGINLIGGTVESCTLSGNSVYGDSGNGILMSGGTVLNSIIWNNGSDNVQNISKSGGTITYSNVNPSFEGEGNRANDPLFVDPDIGDYRLAPASPLLDTGNNQSWMAEATDLDGQPRIIKEQVDMGCYEAVDPDAGPLTCNFEATAVEGVGALETTFTAAARGPNTTIVRYSWLFGDGTGFSSSDSSVADHLYTQSGTYTVTLEIKNELGEIATLTKTAYIYVAPLIAYVSLDGTAQPPYDNWSKAATNIQDAIDSARVIGDKATRVVVSNGLYEIAAQIELLKDITVVSLSGRTATTIKRTSGTSRVIWINSDNALLDGFTLKGGLASGAQIGAGAMINCDITESYQNRGGGGLVQSGGIVSNCLIYGNYDSSNDSGSGSGAGGVRLTGGVLTHSEVRANYALRGYDGYLGSSVGGIRMTGGTAQYLVIRGNWQNRNNAVSAAEINGANAVLRNCLVAGNGNGNSIAIRLITGTIESCTIVRNEGFGVDFQGGTLLNTISHLNSDNGLTGNATGFSYLCVPGIAPGAGNGNNIGSDPRFKNSGSGYGVTYNAGNYQLLSASPCINAGINREWMEGAIDLAGQSRMRGKRVDIGAYESQQGLSTILMLR